MKSQLPVDRVSAWAWWTNLTPGEQRVVSKIMRNLVSVDERGSRVLKDNSTPRSQLSSAYAKAFDQSLFGNLFSPENKKKGEKQIGVAILYLIAHGSDPTQLYQAIFGENLETVKAFWEAVNNHDLDRFESFLHDKFKWISDTLRASPGSEPRPANGPKEGRGVMEAYYKAFPDLRFNVEHTLAFGDVVITRWSAKATQRGTFMGLPPTNRQGTIYGCAVYTLAQGKILQSELFWDTGYLLQQLGMFEGLAQSPRSSPEIVRSGQNSH